MILYGKPVIESKKKWLQDFFSSKKWCYIAILFFGGDEWSRVYVRNKVRFGNEVHCEVKIFWQEKDYIYSEIVELINILNADTLCLGILIQLPLPEWLRPYQQILCDMIDVKKDIDCMTSEMIGKISVARTDVVYPAAVSATIELLLFNKLDNLKGKQVSIIGQSNLIGKPLALYCINQWAQVHSFGIDWDVKIMKAICKRSDYIISATGVVGLVDEGFINCGRPKRSSLQSGWQIVIDIWYGFTKEGKATGDVKFEEVKDLVDAITPVPWGIGPMCVCELFGNVMKLKIQN